MEIVTTSSSFSYSKRNMIFCRIIDHNIKETRFSLSKHIEYVINLSTNYKRWVITKRYTDFENLHKKLKARNYETRNLPEKKFWNMSKDVITQRKFAFEDYLNFLFTKHDITVIKEIAEFIEIEKDLINLLLKNKTMIESRFPTENTITKLKSKSYDSNKGDNYYMFYLNYRKKSFENKDAEDRDSELIIEELLYNLDNFSENQNQIIKQFSEFILAKKEYFNVYDIRKLFFGYNNVNGLLFHIGNINTNSIGANSCLDFLCKMIDSETQHQFDLFLNCLKNTNKEWLQRMNLCLHIQKNTNSILPFKIIKALDETENVIDEILNEREYEKYLNWLKNN